MNIELNEEEKETLAIMFSMFYQIFNICGYIETNQRSFIDRNAVAGLADKLGVEFW